MSSSGRVTRVIGVSSCGVSWHVSSIRGGPTLVWTFRRVVVILALIVLVLVLV